MSRKVVLTTSEGVELEYTLAGLGSRFVACFIDTGMQVLLLLLLFLMVLALQLYVVDLDPSLHALGSWGSAALILLLFLLWNGYYVFFETVWAGQTPGKRNAGLRVIRDDGHPLDFRGALVRNVMRLVDFLPLAYAAGTICIFLSPENRRLGDSVAGTLVIREREDVEPTPAKSRTVPHQEMTVAQADALAGLPLHLLTPDHATLVETFLQRRDALTPEVRSRMAREVADRLRAQMQLAPEQSLAGNDEGFLEGVAQRMMGRAGL